MQTKPPLADGVPGSIAAAENADDEMLVRELLKAGGNLERSVSLFRRHRLMREAAIRVPEFAGSPRFVTCSNWDHRFAGKDRDTKVRWVFDRLSWHVAFLHLRWPGGWSDAGPDDVIDVTESLVFANPEALHDVDGWGCAETWTLPPWAASPTDAASPVRQVRQGFATDPDPR